MGLIFRKATADDVLALMALYKELSENYRENMSRLKMAMNHSATDVYVVQDDETQEIVGTSTFSTRGVPSAGIVGYIDDVVVSSTARRRGIGRLMTEHLTARAWSACCVRIELTSNPKREEAQELYPAMGFSQRDTNNFVLKNPHIE